MNKKTKGLDVQLILNSIYHSINSVEKINDWR